MGREIVGSSRTWNPPVGIDALKSGLFEFFEFKPFRLVWKAELFKDDNDFGGVRNSVCACLSTHRQRKR